MNNKELYLIFDLKYDIFRIDITIKEMKLLNKIKKIPTVGQMVIVRGRPAIVKDITPSKNNTNVELFHAIDVQYIDGWLHPEKDINMGKRVRSRNSTRKYAS